MAKVKLSAKKATKKVENKNNEILIFDANHKSFKKLNSELSEKNADLLKGNS